MYLSGLCHSAVECVPAVVSSSRPAVVAIIHQVAREKRCWFIAASPFLHYCKDFIECAFSLADCNA